MCENPGCVTPKLENSRGFLCLRATMSPLPSLEYHQAVLWWQERQQQSMVYSTPSFPEKGISSPYLIRLKGKRITSQVLSWMKKMSHWSGIWVGGGLGDRHYLHKQLLNLICYGNFFYKYTKSIKFSLCLYDLTFKRKDTSTSHKYSSSKMGNRGKWYIYFWNKIYMKNKYNLPSD